MNIQDQGMTEWPDVSEGAAREARDEIERSPLYTQIEIVRNTAALIWDEATKRENRARHRPDHFFAVELFAESLLNLLDSLPMTIDMVCEVKAQEERKIAP